MTRPGRGQIGWLRINFDCVPSGVESLLYTGLGIVGKGEGGRRQQRWSGKVREGKRSDGSQVGVKAFGINDTRTVDTVGSLR